MIHSNTPGMSHESRQVSSGAVQENKKWSLLGHQQVRKIMAHNPSKGSPQRPYCQDSWGTCSPLCLLVLTWHKGAQPVHSILPTNRPPNALRAKSLCLPLYRPIPQDSRLYPDLQSTQSNGLYPKTHGYMAILMGSLEIQTNPQ